MSPADDTFRAMARQHPFVGTLMEVNPDWGHLLAVLVPHLVFSLVLAFLMTIVVVRRFQVPRSRCLVYFFTISFFLPVVGAVGILAALLFITFFLRHITRPEFGNVPLPIFMDETSEPASGMGEGGAWTRIRETGIPRAQRLKAILAVADEKGRNKSRLLQLATGDVDDEIRLLAFNIHDQQEKIISSSISDALQALKRADSPEERADLHAALAFSYWEMVYHDLARDNLRDFFIDQAMDHALRAQKLGSDKSALSMLTGRIHLERRNVPGAEEAINKALKLGELHSRALPFLAELAYLKREFITMKDLLAQDHTLRHKPGIGQVTQFWSS